MNCFQYLSNCRSRKKTSCFFEGSFLYVAVYKHILPFLWSLHIWYYILGTNSMKVFAIKQLINHLRNTPAKNFDSLGNHLFWDKIFRFTSVFGLTVEWNRLSIAWNFFFRFLLHMKNIRTYSKIKLQIIFSWYNLFFRRFH